MEENKIIDVSEQIIQVLDKIRPFIERDGGDIEFVRYENCIVYVRLYGACLGCASLDYTLTEGVEAILKEEIPEIEKVELVNENMDFDPFLDVEGN